MWTLCLLMISFNAEATPWQWPVTTEFGVTSSFGEYRGLRFHMGLDFSTGGVEGEPVKPARPGRIFQIRATQGGYGRVIYIKHDDGHTTVYAHLAQFGSAITQVLEAQGKPPLSYFGRLNVDIRVKADDIIAHTGESGAGLPHLHFEVRDQRNRAMDPLELNFPPILSLGRRVALQTIRLIPRNPQSRVNGSNLPHEFSTAGTPIQAKGQFDIQILGHIRGARNSRLGLRGIRVHLGNQLIGQWLPRRIDYQRYRTAGAVFDQAFSGFGPTSYAYCFDGRDKSLQIPTDFKATKPIVIEKAADLNIAMMDQLGQWHRFKVRLDPNATPGKTTSLTLEATQATSLSIYGRNDYLILTPNQLSGELITGEVSQKLQSNQNHLITPRPGAPAQDWIWRTDQGHLSRTIGALPNKAPFRYTLGPWQFSGRKSGQKGHSQVVWLEPPKKNLHEGVLEIEGPMLRFGAEGFPALATGVQYSATGVSNPEQLGIYGYARNAGKWRFKASLEEVRTKGLELDEYQPMVLARDIKPPTIGRPKIHQYFVGPKIVIAIRDQGSGIDPDSITVTGPEGKQHFERDRDRGWLVLPRDAKGPWTVILRDKAGHQTTQKSLKL